MKRNLGRRNLFLILAALVAVAAVAGCRGRFDTKPKPYLAELDLRAGVKEVDSSSVLGLSMSSGDGFAGLVLDLRARVRDPMLKGLFLRLGDRLDLEHAEELASLLAPLQKSDIPVVCHADGLGNATAALAARVCKRVVLAPSGEISTVGIAAQNVYFHSLLTDKLGLKLDVLQVGKFKGAEEPFTRDSPSPEARQSLESTLASLQSTWVSMLSARAANAEAWKGAPYGASEALANGMVDALGYADEARESLKASTQLTHVVRLQDGDDEGGASLLRELLQGDSLPNVAVLRAVGSIAMGAGGGDKIAETTFAKQIRELAKDDSVKAVVLRLDSPGGSALASDLLWHELRKLGEKKLLVVSVGGMAASGGQYLASAGARVFVDESSILGSIGVVGGKVVVGDAMEKLGVHSETFTATGGDDGRRARAAMESPFVAWDAATKARVLAEMNEVYELFLARVAEGRKTTKDAVRAHAEGRIFGGKDAVSYGLADEVGGLAAALDYVKATVKLPDNATAGVYRAGGGIFERLGITGAHSSQAPALSSWALAASALGTPKLMSYAAAWEQLRTERVLLLAPTLLEVR